MIEEYRRGIPTYKGENGQTVGMLCETKEQCITDDDGVRLPDKLAELKEYTDAAYANSNLYTDAKIGELINGAPTTLDTLKEIADAMEENADVVEALDAAVGSKVAQAEYDGHADNDTIHITSEERERWNNNSGGGEDLQSIIDGTTPVGDSNKLGGKEASEYALAEELGYFNNWNTLPADTYTSIDDIPRGAWSISTTVCKTITNMPPEYSNGVCFLIRGFVSDNAFGIMFNPHSENAWIRMRYGTKYTWKTLFTTNGGTIDGNVTIGSSEVVNRLLYLQNALRSVYQKVDTDGTYQLYDKTNSKPIITSSADGKTNNFNGAASGNLPLDGGGKVTADMTPIELVSTNASNDTRMKFTGASGVLGWLGFRGVNKPVFFNSNAAMYDLLHTGNSAPCVVVDTDPGVGASVDYPDGTLIFVKE